MNQSRFEQFPSLLRKTGALSLLLSGAAYLFQGFGSLNSFYQFVGFLILAFCICLAGIFCLRKLNDPKSARTFMALAVAAIPALFAQAGSMIHSICGDSVGRIPDFFQHSSEAPMMVALSLLILTPFSGLITYLGLATLDRHKIRPLCLFFLLQSAILLLPLRGLEVILLSALIWVGFYAHNYRDLLVSRSLTSEQKVLQLILFIPLLIIAIRAGFYTINPAFAGLFLMVVGLGVQLVGSTYQVKKLAYWSLPLIGLGLITYLNSFLPAGFFLVKWAIYLPLLHAFFLLMEKVLGQTFKSLYTPLWIIGGSIILLGAYDALFLPRQAYEYYFVDNLALFAVAFVALWEGYRERNSTVFQVGAIVFAVSVAFALIGTLSGISVFHWATLATIGVIVIISASVMEKRGKQALGLVEQLSLRFK